MDKMKRIVCILLTLALVFGVCGCADSEIIESVYSDVVIEGNDTESKQDVSSKQDDAKDNTDSKTETPADASSKKEQANDTGSKKPTTSDGKFDPYAGIEKYKGKAITLAVWWTLYPQEKKSISDFEKKYDIKVKTSYTPSENYTTKFTAEIASGKGPDVVKINYDNYLNFIHNGLVQPINTDIYDLKNDPVYDLYVMDLMSWNGKMYGVNSLSNMTFSKWVLYYNKTMFDNAGVTDPGTLWKKGVKEGNPNKYWNWDSFAECAKKMTSRKNGKTVYGYTGLNTTIGNGWMLTGGNDYVTTDGKTFKNNLTSDSVLKTLNFVSELRQQGYWSPDDATKAFYNGGAAMLGEGSWMLEEHAAYWEIKDETGVVPLPCPAGAGETITYGASVWSVATGAKQPEAASYFIRHWIDFDNVGYENAIPGEAEREVFKYMSDNTKKRQASVAQAIMGYYEASMFWVMLNVSKEKPNDIPVELKSVSSKVDGVISKILSENK